jgi:transposase
MKIVSLDTGKFKTVGYTCDVGTGEERYETLRTTPEAMRDYLIREKPQRVVLEVSAVAGWIYDLVKELGMECQVAHVGGEAWKFKNLKNKNDRVDARKLWVLSTMGELPTVYMPGKGVRQWRGLIGYRQGLIGERTRIRNRIRARLTELGYGWPWGKGGWTRKCMDGLKRLGQPLGQCVAEELWRGQVELEVQRLESLEQRIEAVEEKLEALSAGDRRVRLVRTIPGVGPRLSEVIVAVIDDPARFSNGKQVGAYAGLTPRQHQSGQQDRQGRISGAGNGLLRALLVGVAWLGQQYNPWLKGVFDQACRGSKSRRKIAIVAAARKLLIVAWAMLRDGRAWQEPPTANLATRAA